MFLTVKQAANMTGLSERCIRKGIYNGDIPYYRNGNRFIICKELLEDSIRQKMVVNQKMTENGGF